MKRFALWALVLVGLVMSACGPDNDPVVIKLSVPDGVEVSDLTPTSLTLKWNSVEAAEGYEWRNKYDGNHLTGKVDGCSVEFADLVPESSYTFAVRALAGESHTAWSAEVEVTTPAVEIPDEPEPEPGDEPEPEPGDDPEPEPGDDPEPEPGDDPDQPGNTENDNPANKPIVGNVPLDALIGYAEGTTGGEGGKVHHFNNGAAFRDWLKLREKNKSTEPAIVWLSGTFTKADGRDTGSPWFDIKRTSNITIYGTDSFRMQNVGFFLNEASNIIIRNVYIVQPKADNGADGISMQESQRVWVDHCTFESVNQEKDYEDGSCDVTHATHSVTISWCHYVKTQKSTLVGHSNSASADKDITITMHHNHFDGSNSRHPRVRFGKAHIFNNFYNGVTTYGVGSAYGAMVLVENNSFDGVRLPTDICTYPAKKSGSSWVSNLTGSVAGYLYALDNYYTNKPADASEPYPFTNVEYTKYGGEKLATPYTYDDFRPSYSYVVDAAEQVADIVRSGAGVGRLEGFANAPVEADNGGMNTSGGDDNGNTGGDDTGDDDGGNTGGGDTPVEGSPVGGGWTATAYNGASITQSVADDGALTLSATGKFESSAQKFAYVWRKASGDFTVTVQIDNYTSEKGGNQSLAGLMIANDIAASGAELVYATSGVLTTAYDSHYRVTAGSKSSKKTVGSRAADNTQALLRLTRKGNDFTADYSTDGGATYTECYSGSFATALPDEVYVGLVVSSGDNSKSASATFRNLTLNDTALPFTD